MTFRKFNITILTNAALQAGFAIHHKVDQKKITFFLKLSKAELIKFHSFSCKQ